MKLSNKTKIVHYLHQAKGEPVSGQKLADELQISRNAIWKSIKELQEEGYEIVSIKKKGYVLERIPDKLEETAIRSKLTTTSIGQHLFLYDTVTSTQTIAHEKANEGHPHGTVVLAEEQTKGKGRMARPWDSKKGTGIWMSMILRPELPPTKAPQFTLIAAVAVAKAIEEVTGLQATIKWPNDLLINGKKCTGILTELQADMDRIQSIILGIGMNVNQQLPDFPEELQSIATSLSIEKQEKISRAEVVSSVLNHLERYSTIYLQHGFAPIKVLWEAYSGTIGKRITARMVHQTIEGLAMGITENGVLQLKDDAGVVHEIYSADIEIP